MKIFLTAQSLTIRQGYTPLLEGVNFILTQGEALHLVGVNGSGKTTLLKTLAGLLKPQKGMIHLNNDSFSSNKFHWLGTDLCLKPDLTLKENLILWNWIERAPSSRVTESLTIVEMNHYQDIPIRHLSSGQQRRGALARLLLKDKPVWLLDEPDAYLDHRGKKLLTRLIESHRDNGGLVIFASHYGLPLKTVHTLMLNDFFPIEKRNSWS